MHECSQNKTQPFQYSLAHLLVVFLCGSGNLNLSLPRYPPFSTNAVLLSSLVTPQDSESLHSSDFGPFFCSPMPLCCLLIIVAFMLSPYPCVPSGSRPIPSQPPPPHPHFLPSLTCQRLPDLHLHSSLSHTLFLSNLIHIHVCHSLYWFLNLKPIQLLFMECLLCAHYARDFA